MDPAASGDEGNRRAAEIKGVRTAKLQIDRVRQPSQRSSGEWHAARINEDDAQRIRSVQVNRATSDVGKFTGVDVHVGKRLNVDVRRGRRSAPGEKISAGKCPEVCRAFIAVDLDGAFCPKPDPRPNGNC